jgi:hypothetical protein
MPSRVALPEDFERGGREGGRSFRWSSLSSSVALLARGLDDMRDRLDDAPPGWLVLAVALEALSCLSYVRMFRPVFWRAVSRPIPALTPIRTTAWPSSPGARCMVEMVVAVVMLAPFVSIPPRPARALG